MIVLSSTWGSRLTRSATWSVVMLLSVAGPLPAQTAAFASLQRPVTPLQTAMGGLPANDTGAPALRSNPAGLAVPTEVSMTASHQSWQGDLMLDWFGFAVPFAGGAVGAELSGLHAGSFPSYGPDGEDRGSFRPLETALGIGYGRRIGGRLRAGLCARGLLLDAPGGGMRGASLSGGLECDLRGAAIGVSLRNIGPDLSGTFGSYPLPAEAAAGLVVPFGGARLAGSLTRIASGGSRAQGSISFRPLAELEMIAGFSGVRGGDGPHLRPSAGAAFDLGPLRLAYAFAPSEEGGPLHHVSIDLRRTGSRTFSARGRVADPGISSPCSPEAAPAPETGRLWSVWVGTHSTAEGAGLEARSLRAQGIEGAEVIARPDAAFRVRAATGLDRASADSLSRRIRGIVAAD